MIDLYSRLNFILVTKRTLLMIKLEEGSMLPNSIILSPLLFLKDTIPLPLCVRVMNLLTSPIMCLSTRYISNIYLSECSSLAWAYQMQNTKSFDTKNANGVKEILLECPSLYCSRFDKPLVVVLYIKEVFLQIRET